MAKTKLKFSRGLEKELPTKYSDGEIRFCTDTGALFIDNATGRTKIAAGKADKADKLTAARVITLAGDVTGSVSFDGSKAVTITTTVKDDSHNHIIDNVDGLQNALDDKSQYLGTKVGPQEAVFYCKICTITIPNSYSDMYLEFDLIGRTTSRFQNVKFIGFKPNTTTIDCKILTSGQNGNYYEVNGYQYVSTSGDGDTLELWCKVPSWDALNILKKQLASNGEAKTWIVWNMSKHAELPTTSDTVKLISASNEKWSGNADTATKLGTSTVGSSSQPIYLNAGTPTKISAIGTAYGGTGATSVSGARSNLEVYSKTEVDNKVIGVKNDLLNGAGPAYDTLKELGALIDENTDAIDALETIAASKLPINGGTMTGDIKFTNKGITYVPGDTDQYLWKVYGSEDGKYGYRLQYNGTAEGNENTLVLIADNQEGNEVNAVTMYQDGTTTFAKRITASGGITGTLTGNATTATSATKATQDGSGNNIVNTYATKATVNTNLAKSITGLSVSGQTITYTKGDGSTGTIKTQDTNTTYTFNGAVSTIKDNNLTANRALISNGSGKVAVSDITSTELSYLDGVTSNIQTQLNAKLSKSGGTMTGQLTFSGTGYTFGASGYTANNFGNWTAGASAGSWNIYKSDGTTNVFQLMFGNGNIKTPGTVTATGGFVGNASSATKLATKRTINGTDFDGSGNITTSSWGTARTLTIGDKSQSVNGSQDISWSLNDIGAAPDGLWGESYIDISIEGDADTYYPVLIKASYGKGFPWARLSISRFYSWTAPNSWHNSTHKGGLTLALQWTGDSSWGGNDHYIKVERFHEQYCHMIGGLQLSTDGLIVWLRGGVANYRIHSDMGNKITASIKYSDYTSAGNVVYKARSYDENTVKTEVTKLSITASVTELNYVDGVTSNIQTQLNGKLGASATAAAAIKLTTSAGSETQPVYFSGGKPVACTYALNKTVPADAVFTDTTYSAATTSASGLMTADMVTKLNGIAAGANNYTYTLPTASSALGGVKTTSTVTSTSGLTACPIISGVVYYKDTNTTYSAAGNSLGLVKSGGDVTISNGVIAVNDNSHNHEMNNITNASTKYINAGTVTRKTIVNEAKNSQGYISRVALGLSNPANAFSPALLSVGKNDAGTSWTDFVFGIDGSISSPKGSFVVSTGNVDTSSKPLGFSTRQSAISWGTLANSSYICITRWDTANGGSVVFADKDGQTSMQIDGNFYQNEGNYKVLDTSTGLQLAGGTMSGSIITPKDDDKGIIPHTDNWGQIGSAEKKFFRMYASTFYGNLSGTATKATQDGDGNTITSTYLKLSGGTMSGQIAFPNNSSLYPLSFSASNGGVLVDTYGNFKAASASAQTWNLMDSSGTPRFSVKWATGDTTIEGALSTKGRVITNQGDSAKRQFNTVDTLYLVNRTLDWNANSYYQHVVLLLPVPTSNNFVGTNYFEGKFMFWKTGGNIYDTVYVSLNCVYNQLNYHIHNYGQHNNWKLCVCTYGGISYYALKCPYHDNPYNQAVFHGHLNTSLNSGIIPRDVAYYNENSKSILNSEVYNSLTENLYTKYITSVSAKALISSKGGIVSNQMGQMERSTTAALTVASYNMRYDCMTAADAGSLPAIDNANGILTLNTHEGNYYHQLGFVSGDGGALYRRYFYSVAPNTTQGWYKILDSGNYSSYALPLSGGTLSGPLNTANGTYNKIGDDVSIGDINMAGTLGIMGQNGNTAIQLVNYGASTTTGTSATGVKWTCTGDGTSTISGTTSGTFSGTLDGYSSSRFLKNLGGSNYITINVGGNANTYYPIVIDLVSDKFPMQFVNISRVYYETAPSSWNTETHKGGLTLTLLWNGSHYWDGNGSGGPMYCVHKTETYTTMVAGLSNSTAGAVVWLRGGGAVYHIHSMNGTSATARVYLEGFTDSSSATFSPTTTISNIAIRWPGWSSGADSASNADKLDGFHGSASSAANTYILRDSSNYIWTNYIHSDTVNNENPAIGQVIVTNGSDGFYRKASLSHLKSSLGNMPASYAVCHDVRGVDRAPTYYTDRAVTAWFNETGTPSNGNWYSGLTIKGWSNGYCAWQLASYSSTGSPDDDLWYRAGTASNTWNGWRKIPTIKTITGSGAIGTVTVANNTEYRYTGVTSLALNYSSDIFECWLSITTGSSAIAISFPSGTKFIGTSITSLAANTTYEISIKNKVVIIKKVG